MVYLSVPFKAYKNGFLVVLLVFRSFCDTFIRFNCFLAIFGRSFELFEKSRNQTADRDAVIQTLPYVTSSPNDEDLKGDVLSPFQVSS